MRAIRRARADGLRPPRYPICHGCGRPGKNVRPGRRKCSECATADRLVTANSRTLVPCASGCGEMVKRRTARQMCRPCRERLRTRGRCVCGAEKMAKADVCRACASVKRKAAVAKVPCPRCGQAFWPWANGKHPRTFCNVECAKPPRPSVCPVEFSRCLHCDGAFRVKFAGHACCSKSCRVRYQSKRRKLRLKGLTPSVITVAHIYDRDGGICGLCGQPVDRSLAYPHPMSGTVDHVVPLSRGGAQSLDNTQLAHARCNISKGNREAPHPPRFLASFDTMRVRSEIGRAHV